MLPLLPSVCIFAALESQQAKKVNKRVDIKWHDEKYYYTEVLCFVRLVLLSRAIEES